MHVVVADEIDCDLVESALSALAGFEIVGPKQDWQRFLAQPSDIVIVACAEYSERASQIVYSAAKQRPGRPVVLMSQSSPNGLLRQAFEAGADDVVALPQSPEAIRITLEKVVARRKGSASIAGRPTTPLICVLGPKGGTGKMFAATNLAVVLARRDMNVVLVDLDLQFGDIGLTLGLSPARTMYDLMKAGPPFDHEKLDRHLMLHSSGVKVLVGPTRPDQASSVTVDYLRRVYESLRTMCDVVIVDTPPGFTPALIATIDVSTSAVIVGMLDSLSLKNTKLGIETLELMGYPADRLALVLNRADSRGGITSDDVSAILGRSPDVLVPTDHEIQRWFEEGTPIVVTGQGSAAANAFETLADMYTKDQGTQESPPALPDDQGGGGSGGVREPRRPIKPWSSAGAVVDPADETDLPDDVGRPREGRGRAA